uniref:TerD family protein n=1 Tax=Streptomyces sp. NBC_00003 TaxID=2903608 RepID=A0AAU2V5M8_9ACTN
MSVNLAKGQRISLSKSDASPLVRVRMGLGWQLAAIGEPASGETFQALLPAIDRHL